MIFWQTWKYRHRFQKLIASKQVRWLSNKQPGSSFSGHFYTFTMLYLSWFWHIKIDKIFKILGFSISHQKWFIFKFSVGIWLIKSLILRLDGLLKIWVFKYLINKDSYECSDNSILHIAYFKIFNIHKHFMFGYSEIFIK